jgi:site-specific recombinase XerD
MKKFWNIYVDDFLIEKSVNQWISDRMVEIYITTFRVVETSPYVNLSDLNTYTSPNFKSLLWESFLQKNWWSKTYNHYRTYIRCYCEYLKNEWYLQENPIDKISKRKEPKNLPKTLSHEQVKELLDSLTTLVVLLAYFTKKLQNKYEEE